MDWDIGVFRNAGMTPGVPLNFLFSFIFLRVLLLEVRRERQDSFPSEVAKGTLISRCGQENRAFLELWRDPRCSSRVETVMLGNFLSYIWGFKDPFKAQEGRWDFSRDASAEKGLISC